MDKFEVTTIAENIYDDGPLYEVAKKVWLLAESSG